jgi:hypothetical protein
MQVLAKNKHSSLFSTSESNKEKSYVPITLNWRTKTLAYLAPAKAKNKMLYSLLGEQTL